MPRIQRIGPLRDTDRVVRAAGSAVAAVRALRRLRLRRASGAICAQEYQDAVERLRDPLAPPPDDA